MSETKPTTDQTAMQKLMANPTTLILLSAMTGGGMATGTAVGVDFLGIAEIRKDVAALEIEARDARDMEFRLRIVEAEQDRAAKDRSDLRLILERLDRNVLIMCQQTGAECKN